MPEFPRYTSQARVSTQIETRPQEVMREGSADILDIATKGLAQVSDITMKWAAAMDTIQSTTVKANIKISLIDIEQRAETDPEYNNLDKYFQEIDNLKKANVKGFQNKTNEQQTAIEVDLDLQLAKLRLENIYKKKAIMVGQESAEKLLKLEQSNYINAIDNKGKLIATSNMRTIIDKQVASGIWDKKTGNKLFDEMLNEAQKTLKDNEDIRKKQEKELALAQEFAKNDRENELVEMRINGQLTPEIINSDKTISEEFKTAILNSMKSVKVKDPTSLDSIMKYNELVERDADIAKREKAWFGMGKVPFDELAKFRADVFNANAQGYITDKQLSDLLSNSSKVFYRDPIFQNALNQLAAQSKLYATSEAQSRIKAEMYSNLIQKVIAGKNPSLAVQEVIQERLNAELGEAIKLVEEEGRIFAKKGKQRIYSEDGGITWKDEATGEEIGGRVKGLGYFGELKRPSGGISTELSIGVNIDGKEVEIPTLVPTLTQKEIDYLLGGGEPTETIKSKAINHARKRMSEGKSPFAQKGEQK